MTMHRFLVLLLATLAWPMAAGAQSFDSQDWQVVCDNIRTCRAAGYQREHDDPPVSVLFTRLAGTRSPVFGEVQLGTMGNSPRPGNVRLMVGGKPAGTVAVNRDNRGQMGGAVVDALLRGLAANTSVAFVAGKTTWRLSGDGAAAALAKMDELQGRTGTASAMGRRGTLGDDNVVLPVTLPGVRAVRIAGKRPGDDQLAGHILAMIPHSDDCPLLDDGEARADPRNAPRLWHLDANRVLVTVACWRQGAAGGAGYWIANQKPPFAAHAVTLSASAFDEASTLQAAQKRDGGCGSTEAWTWNGYDFEQTTASTHGLCRGVADGGAWELPTVVSDVTPAK